MLAVAVRGCLNVTYNRLGGVGRLDQLETLSYIILRLCYES